MFLGAYLKKSSHEMLYGPDLKSSLKPQSNEVRARFDLLTSFHQGNRNVDEWYNAVQAQVNLAKYPLGTAKNPP